MSAPSPVPGAVATQVVWSWTCEPCDVAGRDGGDAAPECWNCGGAVVVTARPTLPVV